MVWGSGFRVQGLRFTVCIVYGVSFKNLKVRVKSSITSKPKSSKQFVLVIGLGFRV